MSELKDGSKNEPSFFLLFVKYKYCFLARYLRFEEEKIILVLSGNITRP